jgi:hypothetical protein
MTETDQGEGVVRMMKAIRREGYAGGIIFEWTDEWAKKTWTTEPYMIPFERNPLWYSAVDPEQNYGILAMEPAGIRSQPFYVPGKDAVRLLSLTADEGFLHVQIRLAHPLDFGRERLIIGLDTYDRNRGEFQYGEIFGETAPSGMEFLAEIRSETDASLYVHPGYNVPKGRYSSYPSGSGVFEPMSMLINKERVTRDGALITPIYEDLSVLRRGLLEDNTYYHWDVREDTLFLRLPWGRLHFSDPSAMVVLDDSDGPAVPLRDELKTTTSDGIMVSVLLTDAAGTTVLGKAGVDNPLNLAAFRWDRWDEPIYKEREKESYRIIADYFLQLATE